LQRGDSAVAGRQPKCGDEAEAAVVVAVVLADV